MNEPNHESIHGTADAILRTEFTMSPSIGALVTALVAADIPGVEKRARNSHLNSKYASLDDLIAQARPVLRAQGLVVFQTFAPARGGVCVVTTLAHKSGEWVRGALYIPSPPAKGLSEEQTYGKAATYARRYGYQAILSIAAEEDDDAHVVRDSREVQRTPPPAPPSNTPQAKPPAPKPNGGSTYESRLRSAPSLAELRKLVTEINSDKSLSSGERTRLSTIFLDEKAKLEKSEARGATG
jgi:hypothetical protein